MRVWAPDIAWETFVGTRLGTGTAEGCWVTCRERDPPGIPVRCLAVCLDIRAPSSGLFTFFSIVICLDGRLKVRSNVALRCAMVSCPDSDGAT